MIRCVYTLMTVFKCLERNSYACIAVNTKCNLPVCKVNVLYVRTQEMQLSPYLNSISS